jgi:hypothetical protein
MTKPNSLEHVKKLRCRDHGKVDAELRRVHHEVKVDDDVVKIDNVAAWVCPTCAAVLAVPHAATGRIAAALQERAARNVQEVRVSLELEDLALGVNAAMGTAGTGDAFTLPIHLGLRLVGEHAVPAPSWQRFDDQKKSTRARPRLHPDVRQRLEGLASLWSTDLSAVIRWLTVLAADSVLSGLKPAMHRTQDVFSSTSTINVVPLYPSVAGTGTTSATTKPVTALVSALEIAA